MPQRSAERTEFLHDVLTTAVETGYQWFVHSKIVRNAEYAILSTNVEAVDEEFGIEEDHGTVTIERIASALAKVRSGEPIPYLSDYQRARIISADEHNDAGDIDACDADTILQIALLGEVRYA